MRRLVVNAVLLLLLITGIYGAMACWLLFSPSDASKAQTFGYLDKQRLLAVTPSPRLILVGGSNILTSIDSSLLSRELGMPVVNAGLTAGMGLGFMLESIKPYIRPNDLVLVVPEYENFFGTTYYGTETLPAVLSAFPNELRHIHSFRQRLNLLKNIQPLLLRRILYSLSEAGSKTPVDISNVDSFGDLLGKNRFAQEPAVFEQSFLFPLGDFLPDAVKGLVEFDALVKTRRACLLCGFPFIPAEMFARERTRIESVEKALRGAGLTVMGSPEGSAQNIVYFYDSIYHLNAFGREARTRQVLRDIKNHFSRENGKIHGNVIN